MKPTLETFIAKDNKDVPFEDRARKWEEEVKPLCEKWGVTPWSSLSSSPQAIVCSPALKDLWEPSPK